jgi:hypothetical protein
MNLTVRPATPADKEYMARHLRPEDDREVRTATGESPEVVLPRFAGECYVARRAPNEDPCVIFGCEPKAPGLAFVWLLATPEVKRCPLSVLREARYWINHWAEKYGSVGNFVDTRNELHVRWIKYLGFYLGETYKIRGVPFRVFAKVRECVTP